MDHAFVIPKKSEDPTRVWGGFDLISLPLQSVSSAFLRWENEDTFFFFFAFLLRTRKASQITGRTANI